MWDSKDKVSPKARFDRPKAFKLPQSRGNEENDIENVKKLIIEQGEVSRDVDHASRGTIIPGSGKILCLFW